MFLSYLLYQFSCFIWSSCLKELKSCFPHKNITIEQIPTKNAVFLAPSNIKFLLHWSFTELKRSISRSGKKAIYFYWRSLFSVKIVCLPQLILLTTSIFIRLPLICGKSTWTILIHGKSTWNIFNCQLKKPETIGLDNILPLFGLSSFIGWIHLFQGIFQGILHIREGFKKLSVEGGGG